MFAFDLTRRSKSRFDLARFLPWDEEAGGYDSTNSEMLDNLTRLPRFGQIVVIGEEARLDLIAFKIYQSTAYWWVIMVYNNILSYQEVVPGMVLFYPSLDDLERFLFHLRSQASV